MATLDGTEEKRTVRKTNNYHRFVMLKANRPVTKSHVASIVHSIKTNGSWLKDEPILVNENMEVIDGQHRLIAHRELGLPVYYSVVEGEGITRAQAMNRARRNWTLVDWLYSYANAGNTNYKNFVKLFENNPEVSPGILIASTTDTPLGSKANSMFRSGDLVLNEAGLAKAQERLDMIGELRDIAPVFVDAHVSRILLHVFTHPKYNHERMVRKMQEVGGENFAPSPLVGTILAQLERAYNRSTNIADMVRFQ